MRSLRMPIFRRTRAAHITDDEAEFAASVVAAIRKAPGVLTVEQPSKFSLSVRLDGVSTPGAVRLENLWSDTRPLDADDRKRAIERFVRGVTTARPLDLDWTEAAPRALPAVRSSAALLRLSAPLISSSLAPLINLHVVVDFPDSILFVTAEMVASWQVDAGGVASRAIANLLKTDKGLVPHPDIPEAFLIAGPDGYAASWLAAPEAIAALSTEYRLLVVAPTRDIAGVVHEYEEEAVSALLSWALDEYRASSRRLSPAAYIVDHSTLAPWQPTRGHAAAVKQVSAEAILLATEYGDQKAWLEPLVGDVFVSSVSTALDDHDRVTSHCVWGHRLHALLPKTDRIVFCSRAGPPAPFGLEWDTAQQVAGAYMRPYADVPLDPLLPRWEVLDWPPEDVLAALRAAGRSLAPGSYIS